MNTHYFERWLKAAPKDQANEPREHLYDGDGDEWRLIVASCVERDAEEDHYPLLKQMRIENPDYNLPPDRRELYAGQSYDGNNTDFEVLGLTG